MFNREERHIDASIDKALTELDYYEVSSAEFTAGAKNIETLAAAKKNLDARRLSPEAILSAGVSFASVLAVLHFEKAGVITSKAFSIATRFVR